MRKKNRVYYCHITSSNHIQFNPLDNLLSLNSMKVAKVCNWPIPINYMDLQMLLRFTNFYQRSIHSFLNITCSLFDITTNVSIQICIYAQQSTFNTFKKFITITLVSISRYISALFHIKVNSLDFATGVMLSQASKKNSKQYPVIFLSKFLSPVKCNYDK